MFQNTTDNYGNWLNCPSALRFYDYLRIHKPLTLVYETRHHGRYNHANCTVSTFSQYQAVRTNKLGICEFYRNAVLSIILLRDIWCKYKCDVSCLVKNDLLIQYWYYLEAYNFKKGSPPGCTHMRTCLHAGLAPRYIREHHYHRLYTLWIPHYYISLEVPSLAYCFFNSDGRWGALNN
jgi:hypothetical protein